MATATRADALATVREVFRDPFGFRRPRAAKASTHSRGSPARRLAYASNLGLLFSFVGINIAATRKGPDGAAPAVDMWREQAFPEWVHAWTGVETYTAGLLLYWAFMAFLGAPAFQMVLGIRRLRALLPLTLGIFVAAIWYAWACAFVWPSLPGYIAANAVLNFAYSVNDLVLDQCQMDVDSGTGGDGATLASPTMTDQLSMFDESPHADQSYRAVGGVVFMLVGVALLATSVAPDQVPVGLAMALQLALTTALTIPAVVLSAQSATHFVAPSAACAETGALRRSTVVSVAPLFAVTASLMLPDAVGDAVASALVRQYKTPALAVVRLLVSGTGWCLSHPRIHVVVARMIPTADAGTSTMWPILLLVVRAGLLGLFCQVSFGDEDGGWAWDAFAIVIFVVQCLVDSIGGRMMQNVGDTQNRSALWGTTSKKQAVSWIHRVTMPTWMAHFSVEVLPAVVKRTVTVYSDSMVSAVLTFADQSAAAGCVVALTYLATCVVAAFSMSAAAARSKTCKGD